MNRTLMVFLLLIFCAIHGYSQNRADNTRGQTDNDSIAIFTFKPNSDMFFAPYQNNESELNRLIKITKQYDTEIKEGKLPVYVNGYCYRSMRKEQNLALARTWSNRVKSELILRRRLKEEHFITRNHSEPYYDLNYAVVVMLRFPRDIIKEEIPEEEEEVKESKKPEPIVIKEVIEDKTTGEISEIEVTIPPKDKESREEVMAQLDVTDKSAATFSIHTNLLYWGIATPNIGAEWRPDEEKRWGILANGAWSHWNWRNRTRKYRMWLVSAELRRYLSDRWFVGAELHTGELNVKLSETGRQGKYYGGGVLGGYRWPVSRKFDIDFTLGLGYTYFDKEHYITGEEHYIGTKRDAGTNFWGPTQAGVILRYKLLK